MHIHFIGINGISMRWLAERYSLLGHTVSGSDLTINGHKPENVVGADLVVYTSAIDSDNAEIIEAKKRNIPLISRAAALGKVSKQFDGCLAVAGTHGKTTVTGMIAEIFGDAEPALHIGGTVGGRHGKAYGSFLITEACEYKRNFLSLEPDLGVVLNVELDHTDCYECYGDILNAFGEFSAKCDEIVIPQELSSYLKPKFGGRRITVGKDGNCFLVSYGYEKQVTDVSIKIFGDAVFCRLNTIGLHNAQNAVFAAAAAKVYGASLFQIREGLERFKGIDRRLSFVGSLMGMPVISDYAHHPSEITAGMSALRSAGYNKPLAVFQPHTYSRLNALLNDFAQALMPYNCIILPVYKARGESGGISSQALADALNGAGGRAQAVDSFEEGAEQIKKEAPTADCVIVMGAGDNEKLLPLIL